MLYALARHGEVLEGEIDALATRALAGHTHLSSETESHLVRAIALADSPALTRHLAPLVARLHGRLRTDSRTAQIVAPTGTGYGWIFTSDTRSTAYGLCALIAATTASGGEGDPAELAIAARLVRGLMQRRTHGHWPSTQDNAAVVEALSAFHTAYERVAPDLAVAVRVAGRTMIEAGFRERSTRAVQEAWPLERVVAAADTAASRAGRGASTTPCCSSPTPRVHSRRARAVSPSSACSSRSTATARRPHRRSPPARPSRSTAATSCGSRCVSRAPWTATTSSSTMRCRRVSRH
jgi:hypothetical protein